MVQSVRSNVSPKSRKLTGEILQEAGLISPEQIKIALDVQRQCVALRIGEILAIKGWLKQETVDFLVTFCLEDKTITYNPKPIGYYFQKAGLLTEEQVNNILKDQKKLGIKFCYLAVMKGFLPEKTADFFLENITTKIPESPIINDKLPTETVIGDPNLYESIKDQDTIINHNDIKEIINNQTSYSQDIEIEYSPIWIDV
ncbi:hypothetical protein [Geminocystis herdmanii]|uniref:hypothetical protein n=1 Tax=Geminocystis herdmanii TaxID=669359 RepID=UPI0003456870|nr:hypothetical protein [Geminocystis herdmanii]